MNILKGLVAGQYPNFDKSAKMVIAKQAKKDKIRITDAIVLRVSQ
jgi:hypothetical protein